MSPAFVSSAEKATSVAVHEYSRGSSILGTLLRFGKMKKFTWALFLGFFFYKNKILDRPRVCTYVSKRGTSRS